jgi:hypothetical protein
VPTRVLERGDIFFVYRPRVGETAAQSIDDVQRMWMLLSPHGRGLHRRLCVGKKRLPALRNHERHWAFVERVERDPVRLTDDFHGERYQTRTRGERFQPPARPAGEGVYALVEHDDHRHLVYRLELPAELGDVQRDLGICEQASYIATAMNVVRWDRRPLYPASLQARFRDRRFAPLDPEFLDVRGTELILIATTDDIEAELGLHLEIDREIADSADLFRWLAEEEGEHPLRPLFSGEWA